MKPRVLTAIMCWLVPFFCSTGFADQPRLAHQDFTLIAGKPSPKGCYPELVRVERSGRAIFRLQQDGPVIVRAPAGEQIPEGESDFYGFVIRVRRKAADRHHSTVRPWETALKHLTNCSSQPLAVVLKG